MAPIYTLLLIMTFSYLVVKAGAVALMMTGLSFDSAMFQAQSAFMGVGFTTRESETVVNHPARRRIISWLMLTGYLSLGSVIASLVANFGRADDAGDWAVRIAWLGVGAISIFLLTRLPGVRNGVVWLFTRLIASRKRVRLQDYEELLRVDEGFAVAHMTIEPENWMADKSLRQMRLTDEGVIVLNIVRGSGNVFATPGPDTALRAGDKLLLYGHEDCLARLAERNARGGELEHLAVARAARARREAEEATDRAALEGEPEPSAEGRD
jgi:hypothetical protein